MLSKAKNDGSMLKTDLNGRREAVAKADAKAKADVAKETIDREQQNAAVNQAQNNGTSKCFSKSRSSSEDRS